MSKALGTCEQPPSLTAPLVNCCCMLNSELARPRRLEAPQSGVPQSHWNTVKYPEQEREGGPRGGPGSWRVERCTESQGQALTAGTSAWVGGRRGLLCGPPALAQRLNGAAAPPLRVFIRLWNSVPCTRAQDVRSSNLAGRELQRTK